MGVMSVTCPILILGLNRTFEMGKAKYFRLDALRSTSAYIIDYPEHDVSGPRDVFIF